MAEIKSTINILKTILLMWLILFSLAPCGVKEVFAHSLEVNYQQPFNKSKTTTSIGGCQSSPLSVNSVDFQIENNKLDKRLDSIDFFNRQFLSNVPKVLKAFPERFTGNS